MSVQAHDAPWRHVDVSVLAAVGSIAAIGLIMVNSATTRKLASQGVDPHFYLKRQVVFVAVGMAAMVFTATVDYRVYRDFAPFVYGGTILAPAAVVSPLGASTQGTPAWFPIGSFQLQPSEISKVALVLSLATYLGHQRDGELDRRRLLTILALGGI